MVEDISVFNVPLFKPVPESVCNQEFLNAKSQRRHTCPGGRRQGDSSFSFATPRLCVKFSEILHCDDLG